jgi:hypothetical protein
VAPLLCVVAQVHAQSNLIPTSIVDSLVETGSLRATVAGMTARCVQLSPDQKEVFEVAYQAWLQRNLNEANFIDEAIQKHFANNPPDKARFEAQLNLKVSNEVKLQDMTAAKCTQWLVSQQSSARVWDFNIKLPAHMRLIESRFVKPS